MAPIPENGILRTASNHSVEETVSRLQSILQAKGVKLFYHRRPQRRSRQRRPENAKHQAAHLRQSQGRHTSDARFAQPPLSTSRSKFLIAEGRRRKGLDLLQHACLPPGTPPSPARAASQYRGDRYVSRQSRRMSCWLASLLGLAFPGWTFRLFRQRGFRPHSEVFLACIQIFRPNFLAAAALGSGDDHSMVIVQSVLSVRLDRAEDDIPVERDELDRSKCIQ